jgi:hypothetical protein
MTHVRRATLCQLANGDRPGGFRRRLDRLLGAVPAGDVERRLGLGQAPACAAYALGRLCPDGTAPRHAALPGGLERFGWTAAGGLPVWLWHAPAGLGRTELAQRLVTDMPLTTEYVLRFEGDAWVEDGWWPALLPLLEQGIDYLGRPAWGFYGPGQAEALPAQPWYRGRPPEVRDGRPGVEYFGGGFAGVRVARLREVDRPGAAAGGPGGPAWRIGDDLWLGEVARQQGWTRAAHDRHLRTGPAPGEEEAGSEGEPR